MKLAAGGAVKLAEVHPGRERLRCVSEGPEYNTTRTDMWELFGSIFVLMHATTDQGMRYYWHERAGYVWLFTHRSGALQFLHHADPWPVGFPTTPNGVTTALHDTLVSVGMAQARVQAHDFVPAHLL